MILLKRLFFIVGLTAFFLSCKGQHVSPPIIPQNYLLFAKIKNNVFDITADTAAFVKNIKDNLFYGKVVNLNKITIRRQLTLEAKNEFYYILVTDEKQHIKVAKWLIKLDDQFFINDLISTGNLFEQSYLVCIGEGDCSPQVLEIEDEKQWGCSTDIQCYVDGAAAAAAAKECKSYKSIIQ